MDGRRMLVVEDDATTRHVLRKLFTGMGWQVVVTATATEAFAVLDPPPTVLILDLNLPDKPGEAILRKVRGEGLPTWVAVYTGTDDPERLAAVRGLSPDYVLQKPGVPDFAWGELPHD